MSKNRDLILHSARDLFSERNFEQVTIKEICSKAGVANSTFYYHFRTKEELMDCLRASDSTMLHSEWIDLATTTDLLEQVLTACSMCAVRAERHGHMLTAQYYKCKIGQERELQELAGNRALENETAITLIRHAQKQGIIANPEDADRLAYAAMWLTSGIIVEWCACSGGFDLRGKVRAMLLTLFNVTQA